MLDLVCNMFTLNVDSWLLIKPHIIQQLNIWFVKLEKLGLHLLRGVLPAVALGNALC